MNITFTIPSESLIATYGKVKLFLKGHDDVIFQAMSKITANRARPFKITTDPIEYEDKHQDIERRLKSTGLLDGRTMALQLMEEIYRQIKGRGGLPGKSKEELLNLIVFKTNQNVLIKLSEEIRWQAAWIIPTVTDQRENTYILVDIYDSNWGECVPAYVIEYIGTAIDSYIKKIHSSSIVLLTIAIEATLRDVLRTRGYDFNQGGTSVDIYDYAKAVVGIDGSNYTLTFQQPMPKGIADFGTSVAPGSTIDIEIRRVVKPASQNRIDLSIKTPLSLIDHWSSASIAQHKQKKVNGLGEAINIARNVERTMLPRDLPTDYDDVILKVRNNLVHLSGSALSVQIADIDDPDQPGQPITLGKLLKTPEIVFDLIVSVPSFVNKQYIDLRKAGHLA